MQHESFMLREKRLLSALSAALLPQPAFPGNVLHAKLITRVLVRALLSCGASHSAVVLKWPKTLAAPCPLTSLIPTITSKTAPFQGTLTEQPSSLGLQLAQRVPGAGAGAGTVWGLITGSASNSSPEGQLFGTILGFALRGHGALPPTAAFPILFAMLRSPFYLPRFFLPSLTFPVCSFSYTFPGSIRKADGSGFDRRKKIRY